MKKQRPMIFILLIIAGLNFVSFNPVQAKQQQQAQTAQAKPPQQKPAAPPRGRSITLGDLTGFDVKDNVFTIAAGPDLVRVIFYRDDIFRIWLGPDGNFTEPPANPEDAPIVVYQGRADLRRLAGRGRLLPDRQPRNASSASTRGRSGSPSSTRTTASSSGRKAAACPTGRPRSRPCAAARTRTSTAAACRTATSPTATPRSTSGSTPAAGATARRPTRRRST